MEKNCKFDLKTKQIFFKFFLLFQGLLSLASIALMNHLTIMGLFLNSLNYESKEILETA